MKKIQTPQKPKNPTSKIQPPTSNLQPPTSNFQLLTSAKGITLTSLVIYIIAMTIIMGTISNLTIYFYKNVHSIQDTTDTSSNITRFNMYFTNDIKQETIKVKQESPNKIILTNKEGKQIIYTIAGDGIYKNKIKICNGIQQGTTFSVQEIYNETKTTHKTQIIVNIKMGENEIMEKRLEYTINN